MPIYNYNALKNRKEIVKGKIEAADLKEAREMVRAMGLIPTKVEEESQAATHAIKSKVAPLPKLSLQEKIDFTSAFQILIQSGISAIEALTFLENDAAKPKLKIIAREIRRQIMGGATFAETLERYPQIFGYVYIGLAKAGEDSGELEKTLERLLDLLKKQAAIKSRVIGTLMYPCFVILLAIAIVTLMLVFVFPAFREMFEMQDKPLPWITATLMDMGEFLKANWLIPVLLIPTIVITGMFLLRWEPSKRIIDDMSLKVALLKDLILFSNLSNFIAVMQVAYDAGIPVVDCLYLSSITLTNYTLQDNITASMSKVQQGQQLSVALKSTGVIPKMLNFMIATGEQSGRLGEMLYQGVLYLDKQLDTIIDTLTKMLEPLMLLVIGSIVLVLALALYLPLFASYLQ